MTECGPFDSLPIIICLKLGHIQDLLDDSLSTDTLYFKIISNQSIKSTMSGLHNFVRKEGALH